MQERRKFLKMAALTAAVFAGEKRVWGQSRVIENEDGIKASPPLVVSTWDFGIAANEAAWKVLMSGGRALDAVEAGVRIPEADPKIQTIGLGGLPDRDGHVTLDACIMDELGNGGAVGCLENFVHAISIARAVMEKTPHVMLVGGGAAEFALSQGYKKQNLLTPESEKAWKEWLKTSKYEPEINIENKTAVSGSSAFNPLTLPGNKYNHDTIGMLAIDTQGNLSGACSTSGMAYKMHGRVGDSPILGDGLFVDNEIGAATSTGVGEANMRICGTHTVVEMMRLGHSPQESCRIAVERVVKKDYAFAKSIQLGYLAINKHGEVGAFCLQKGFNYALYSHQINNRLFDGKSYF
ncbi:MAG: N(4)-(beta-N-acetylglucosaminyl)-L-asparaginase [Chitinophagaceae bacterium]